MYPIGPDGRDIATAQSGFLKRVAAILPEPVDEKLQGLKVFVRKWVKKNIKPVTVMGFEEWLGSTHYNEHRKDELRKAASLTNHFPSARKCSKVEQHIKREAYPEYKQARTINSRCDEFKAWSGPIFKSIEKQVYAVNNTNGQPFFVKHMTNPERVSRILAMSQPGRKYYATDYTSFESHFTPQIMESIEMVLYEHALRKYPGYYKRIHDVLCGPNHISNRMGMKMTIRGRRMSGDMNTSLGNGFSNLMLALYLAKVNKSTYFDGVFEGDDALFTTNSRVIASDYADLGFTIKIEPHNDVQSAKFCGLLITPSNHTIRDPTTVMSTLMWNMTHPCCTHKTAMRLLRAKVMSLAVDAGSAPILWAVCSHLLTFTQSYTPNFTDPMTAKKVADHDNIRTTTPTNDDRLFFDRVFHISPQLQVQHEALILKGDFSRLHEILSPHPDHHDFGSRFLEVQSGCVCHGHVT